MEDGGVLWLGRTGTKTGNGVKAARKKKTEKRKVSL
jgi:hypothetical protein